jgi:hypothetical protein
MSSCLGQGIKAAGPGLADLAVKCSKKTTGRQQAAAEILASLSTRRQNNSQKQPAVTANVGCILRLSPMPSSRTPKRLLSRRKVMACDCGDFRVRFAARRPDPQQAGATRHPCSRPCVPMSSANRRQRPHHGRAAGAASYKDRRGIEAVSELGGQNGLGHRRVSPRRSRAEKSPGPARARAPFRTPDLLAFVLRGCKPVAQNPPRSRSGRERTGDCQVAGCAT